MRNITTYAFFFILLTAGTLSAQTQSSIVIDVSATLVSDSPVVLTTLSSMKVAGVNSGSEIYISPIANTNAGLMLAEGKPGSQARLTYIMTEVLDEENGNGSITMRYEMSSFPERVQRSSKLIDTGEAILNFGNDGKYYLWVGGHIDLSKASGGKYIGQFTIEIEYI